MKVAVFNIQKFGRSKVSDPDVLKILVKIVSRYDIIVILEVVDARGKSVTTPMEALNKANRKHHYTLKFCSCLGGTRYKEQFMFLYRDNLVDLVDVVGSCQFDDVATEGGDVFARDLFILRFRCLNTVLKDLVIIPVHTKPDDSEKELDELYDVFLNVKRKWRTDNVMILGDFSSVGSYVSQKDMRTIRIRSDPNFHWLIGDDVDTTASTQKCHTYDRMAVYGDDMLQAVVPKSAKIFNFQKAFNLTDEQALNVSHHYPVEVELKSAVLTINESDGPDKLGGLVTRKDAGQTEKPDEDVLQLKRGNLLLEREKLNLEIQILRLKMAEMRPGVK